MLWGSVACNKQAEKYFGYEYKCATLFKLK